MQNTFSRTSFWLISTRLIDSITTFLVTPNLEYELNPIVSLFNLGVIDFVLVGIIFTLALLVFSFYSFQFLYVFDFKSESYFYYWSRYFSSTSADRNSLSLNHRVIVFIGQVLPIFVIYNGVFCILNNLFMLMIDYSTFLEILWNRIIVYHTTFICFNMIAIFFFTLHLFMYSKFIAHNTKK